MDGNMASCSQKEESQWETRMSVLFEAKQYPEFRANMREYYPSFWLPLSLSHSFAVRVEISSNDKQCYFV